MTPAKQRSFIQHMDSKVPQKRKSGVETQSEEELEEVIELTGLEEMIQNEVNDYELNQSSSSSDDEFDGSDDI